MRFLVLKSYDGGRTWEQTRRCADFASAAKAAELLRSRHRMIRFRVDVEATPARPKRRSQRASRSRPRGHGRWRTALSARK